MNAIGMTCTFILGLFVGAGILGLIVLIGEKKR
jgi:hypothetical protein